MEDCLIDLALKAGLINYVDNETPRRYFICGHADLEEVAKFAKLVRQQTLYDLRVESRFLCGND